MWFTWRILDERDTVAAFKKCVKARSREWGGGSCSRGPGVWAEGPSAPGSFGSSPSCVLLCFSSGLLGLCLGWLHCPRWWPLSLPTTVPFQFLGPGPFLLARLPQFQLGPQVIGIVPSLLLLCSFGFLAWSVDLPTGAPQCVAPAPYPALLPSPLLLDSFWECKTFLSKRPIFLHSFVLSLTWSFLQWLFLVFLDLVSESLH